MIQKPNQELFSRAWRMSVDNREKVRCNAEAIFGKDACWTRCFDFKKPIEGHRHIKGIRFMTSNDGTTCMYTIRHDGNVDSVVDENLRNTLISEIKTMPSSEKGICGWIKEVSRKYDDIEVEIKNLGGGLYWKRYNDGSGSILNSSGQILHFELPKYDNIQAVIYLGKYDGMEVLAIRSADFSISSVGLYDINGKNVSFHPGLDKINCYFLGPDGREKTASLNDIANEFAKLTRKNTVKNNNSILKLK